MEAKNKEYVLVALPYPSSDAMHIGHAYNYAIMDSYCRWKRYKGIEVFQPFGYDAFGLPAENYARKHGRDPREVTYENIAKFDIQMEKMNTSYERLLITSEPSYYKWTQWLFLKLLEKGLAYKKKGPVNYCPSCETVLANEQVKSSHDKHNDKKFCDRCSSEIEIKDLEQWYFKITDYKDRLIKNLEWLDYPESTKKQQLHWFENFRDWSVGRQRKFGCSIPIEGETDTLDTFVDSSFYYLRYLDPTNENEFLDKSRYKQVDLYVIGAEHATSHLIYARFINMFLYDCGIVSEEEPFKRLIHQGFITHKGEKMSKSKGNVINPDDYNQDELRLYLSFLGHYFDGGDWDDSKIVGIRRFIARFDKWLTSSTSDGEILDLTSFENKINGYVESFKFNKVVSSFMEFYNAHKHIIISNKTAEELVVMFGVFAPGLIFAKNKEIIN